MKQKITITLFGTSAERFALLNTLHDIEQTPHSPNYPFLVKTASIPNKYTIIAHKDMCPKTWNAICESPDIDVYKKLAQIAKNAILTIQSNYTEEPVEKPKTFVHLIYENSRMLVKIDQSQFEYILTGDKFVLTPN